MPGGDEPEAILSLIEDVNVLAVDISTYGALGLNARRRVVGGSGGAFFCYEDGRNYVFERVLDPMPYARAAALRRSNFAAVLPAGTHLCCPADINLSTTPADTRFPNVNQARHCYMR